MNRYSLCTLALLALTSHATAGNVLVVDDDPGGDFANIADAIQAAGPTDLILIRDGLYDAFSIQSKDVSLIADRDAQVTVVGQTSVFSLQADQSVIMRGLDFQALAPREALSIEDNQGSVWIEDAIIQGQSGFAPVALIFRDAVHAFHSDAVIFNNCDIRGGTAAGIATPAGGVGLRGSESFITVNASIIRGGDAPTGINLSMPAPRSI